MTDLDALMEQERDKLRKQREEARALLEEAEAKLQRIDAYFGTAPVEKKTRAPRASGKRAEILQVIADAPDGLTRAELIEKLGAHDKQTSMSLSNALAALKKGGQLRHDGRVYSLPKGATASTSTVSAD